MSAASFTERWPKLFKDLGEREIAAPLHALSSMGEGGWEVGFEEVRALTDVSRGELSRDGYVEWARARARTLAAGGDSLNTARWTGKLLG